MATIGHLAAGLALGRVRDRPSALLTATVVAAALLPDVDFLLRIDHRGPTHSVGLALATALAAHVAFRVLGRPDAGAVAFLSGCAVLSHIGLDLLTAHQPVAALWPLTRDEFNLGSTWLPAAPTDEALLTGRGVLLLAAELGWSVALIAGATIVGRWRSGAATRPAASPGR